MCYTSFLDRVIAESSMAQYHFDLTAGQRVQILQANDRRVGVVFMTVGEGEFQLLPRFQGPPFDGLHIAANIGLLNHVEFTVRHHGGLLRADWSVQCLLGGTIVAWETIANEDYYCISPEKYNNTYGGH